MSNPIEWSVRAQNLPEHAHNRIHTDQGAREAGFPAALVAGVTTYAYQCHPLIAAWGLDWVAHGGCELRLRSPVFQDDLVRCVPSPGEDGTVIVDAVVDDSPALGTGRDASDFGRSRATIRAWRVDTRVQGDRPGEELPAEHFVLDDNHGPDYAVRAGDTLDLLVAEGVVHPAAWPSLANGVFSRHLVRGSWIHTRSRITHHGLAQANAEIEITGRVVDRFVRSGQRAIADLVIRADGKVVCSIEHEAIIDLTP
jgi:hypothetical protein